MTDFSYQLYSSRNFTPMSDTFAMLTDLGYKSVEGYGGIYASKAAIDSLKVDLADSGLTMPTTHMDLNLVENEPGQAIEIAKLLGIKSIFVPHLAVDQRPTDADGWRAFGKRLQAAGKPLCDAGIAFGWHNHDFEFSTLPTGELPIDLIFEGGPLLHWEADIAWIARGGKNPLDYIKKFGDRLTAAHIKDIAPEGEKADEDGWADVGDGTMDWPAIMAALRKTKAEAFVMEHDNPSDDRRFAERSLKAAKQF
ncbi:sugar phosphate isomerase/epimerase [Pararhizobium sp. IMCC21322]|uniref:sugar phosphate isomerase/epimerase family protein n=1 Tax=Pararhizobium sp. IMCC21322 TaxID=3067903 RepID=UPI002740AAD9|nr:sugar phosphate isomerase/epimerase [Pararhizobium sp. IMCC21322]